ncbi:uncharacterized protein IL334_005533 [Kwoniella shivajii]|uniref:GH18 domain-containing protein n=1 Tax=Kwoniella shivajii TaxID=564305 RepID=A0ABZ1D6I1_9TREE|nr:hypothetical protein IL334_005533 [Kwoniella shivajii]
MHYFGLLTLLSLIPFTESTSLPLGYLHHPQPRSDHGVLEERQTDGTGWHGYRSVGYYPNWVIYNDDPFTVNDITAKDFTHIIYAFANVDRNSGAVYLGDNYADTQFPYPGDNPDNDQGNNLYGNLKQLFLLKKNNRNLKIQLGIGGATYSSIARAHWYTHTCSSPMTAQTASLVDLFKRLRTSLNNAASQIGGGHFILSWAAACGFPNWSAQDVRGMDQYLDYWNLMAYDFSGPWTDMALPASNLLPDKRSSDVNASGSQCLQHYIDSGVDSRKLNLGLPLYGTGFTGTRGMWTSYSGNEQYNTAELPLDGDPVQYDAALGGSWSYNPSTGRVVSFDTPTLAIQKANYVISHNIGGMMYWSIDGDYTKLQPIAASLPDRPARQGLDSNGQKCTCPPVPGGGNNVPINTNIGYSLVDTVVTAFKRNGGGLDNTQNRLKYPNSEYDNIRNGL